MNIITHSTHTHKHTNTQTHKIRQTNNVTQTHKTNNGRQQTHTTNHIQNNKGPHTYQNQIKLNTFQQTNICNKNQTHNKQKLFKTTQHYIYIDKQT